MREQVGRPAKSMRRVGQKPEALLEVRLSPGRGDRLLHQVGAWEWKVLVVCSDHGQDRGVLARRVSNRVEVIQEGHGRRVVVDVLDRVEWIAAVIGEIARSVVNTVIQPRIRITERVVPVARRRDNHGRLDTVINSVEVSRHDSPHGRADDAEPGGVDAVGISRQRGQGFQRGERSHAGVGIVVQVAILGSSIDRDPCLVLILGTARRLACRRAIDEQGNIAQARYQESRVTIRSPAVSMPEYQRGVRAANQRRSQKPMNPDSLVAVLGVRRDRLEPAGGWIRGKEHIRVSQVKRGRELKRRAVSNLGENLGIPQVIRRHARLRVEYGDKAKQTRNPEAALVSHAIAAS